MEWRIDGVGGDGTGTRSLPPASTLCKLPVEPNHRSWSVPWDPVLIDSTSGTGTAATATPLTPILSKERDGLPNFETFHCISPTTPAKGDASQVASSGPSSPDEEKLPPSADMKMVTELNAPKVVERKPRPRRYQLRIPSNYCHVCQRKSIAVNQVICCNLLSGSCRKAVCEVCFEDNGWDWNAAIHNPNSWVCPHCSGICPTRAQCYTYMKTNCRRRNGEVTKRTRKPKSTNQLSSSGSVVSDTSVLTSPEGSPAVQTISSPTLKCSSPSDWTVHPF
mmetsp:Transcript_3464/g.6496  ORF Transcript_3464/g.6496 Transcript_3464/m.6496 type:complete len:278 (+) Transcript_3464:254-1087(+)